MSTPTLRQRLRRAMEEKNQKGLAGYLAGDLVPHRLDVLTDAALEVLEGEVQDARRAALQQARLEVTPHLSTAERWRSARVLAVFARLLGEEFSMRDPAGPDVPMTMADFDASSQYTYQGIPLVEDENGNFVMAWGHVDPEEMALAVAEYEGEVGTEGPGSVQDADVQHVFAVATQPPDSMDGWRVTWEGITQDAPGAFPLTVLLY